MNTMNIYPIHSQTAARKHWIVRILRYFGFLTVIAGTICGTLYARAMFTVLLSEAFNISLETSQLIVIVLAAILSFGASMLVTLPYWGLALMIDDLHALRLYASGYVVHDQQREQ